MESCYIGGCRLRVCMAGFCQFLGTVCKLSTSITPTGRFSTSSRLRQVRENCGMQATHRPEFQPIANDRLPRLAPRTSQQQQALFRVSAPSRDTIWGRRNSSRCAEPSLEHRNRVLDSLHSGFSGCQVIMHVADFVAAGSHVFFEHGFSKS